MRNSTPRFTPHIIVGILLSITLWGCASYYQQNLVLQQNITSGNFEKADKILSADKKGEEGKNRVLYFMNKGTVNFMMNNHEVSNAYFEKADLYIEDFKRSAANEALALISNSMVRPYKPEDFEAVMIHYYKSLNYLFLNQYDEAIVEAKRVNILLHQINDKYSKSKNKYSDDAFAHNLMGIIYDASGDKNNAFIAYRNALELYESKYTELFKLAAPQQLKKDILRTSYELGFGEEHRSYKEKFNMSYEPDSTETGDLVFLWMNGFGPVKDEWSINFTNTGYNNGWITLVNEQEGFSFPIYIGNKSKDQQNAYKNLSFLRVAFPKYKERKPLLFQATLTVDNSVHKLELAENINAIAFRSLKDRMAREMAYGIARLATKKAMESIANNQDQNIGTIVSIVNAMTEKADTRNWQSLPYAIHYSRVKLPEGNHQVTLNAKGKTNTQEQFNFEIKNNKTTFFCYHELNSQPIK
ncbi:COG3014 family protein [Saccharicrinis aurantiacus]|uniref:COG3014 family protein n=1 Tax=Saccharicrinis aurantiacus TaxID=1849719 RepID=UPI00248F9E19|nr:hypothetical protein [Saccharicrinis aurantiacus]